MSKLYYIGLDIHKRVIAYCIKALDGRLVGQGKIEADRKSVGEWIQGLPGPWIGAMEATIFTGRVINVGPLKEEKGQVTAGYSESHRESFDPEG